MLFGLFLLSFIFISLGAAVQDPLYYNLLGVKPDASSDLIKAAFEKRLAQYSPHSFQALGEEGRRLQEIIKNVSLTLLDPAMRQEYDTHGPSTAFSLKDFSQIFLDDELTAAFQTPAFAQPVCRFVTKDSYLYDSVFGIKAAIPYLINHHIDNEMVEFVGMLRRFHQNIFASWIHNRVRAEREIDAVYEKDDMYTFLLLNYQLPLIPNHSLEDFDAFLGAILEKFQPLVQRHIDFTVLDRISQVRSNLCNPTFVRTLNEQLSPDTTFIFGIDRQGE